MKSDNLAVIIQIRQLASHMSVPQISEETGIPMTEIRAICRKHGIAPRDIRDVSAEYIRVMNGKKTLSQLATALGIQPDYVKAIAKAYNIQLILKKEPTPVETLEGTVKKVITYKGPKKVKDMTITELRQWIDDINKGERGGNLEAIERILTEKVQENLKGRKLPKLFHGSKDTYTQSDGAYGIASMMRGIKLKD